MRDTYNPSMTSQLDKLYDDLTAATGIARARDVRLERIAMDRALEARFQVGTDGAALISHPINQLKARVFRLQDATASVHENAVWGYYNEWQDGKAWNEVVEAWMSSPEHRANLMRATDTTWGLGYHHSPPGPGQTNDRYYFILILTEDLWPVTPRYAIAKDAKHWGFQVTASGEIIGRKGVKLGYEERLLYDARADFPGIGPSLHAVSGTWDQYWVRESALFGPEEIAP